MHVCVRVCVCTHTDRDVSVCVRAHLCVYCCNCVCLYVVCVLHRLAAHINGYKCFQIELTRGYDYKAFHEDLKSLFTMTGIKGEDTVFLFTDTQVRHCNSHRLLHIVP